MLLLPALADGADSPGQSGRIGPPSAPPANGRFLRPAGWMTTVGDFPSGAALTPDGRFYWAVDSGHGRDDVQIVDVGDDRVVQVLPLPGAYGGIAFTPSGRTAYVSGEPIGNSHPLAAVKGTGGDVIHVFTIDPSSGRAGLAVTPDALNLVVALNQADQVAIVDLQGGGIRLVPVGRYPVGVVITRDSKTAYVTNECDARDRRGDARRSPHPFAAARASAGPGRPRCRVVGRPSRHMCDQHSRRS
jgi:DNA-binding beta-propeller fold protein YncE